MKAKLLATTALLATLMGLSSMSRADNGQTFTPIDQLPPAQRQAIMAELQQMHLQIDWSEVVVGVNEKGEITFKSRATECLDGAQPSCYSGGIAH